MKVSKTFPKPIFQAIFNFLKELVNKMLSLKPEDRPSADKCLEFIENPDLIYIQLINTITREGRAPALKEYLMQELKNFFINTNINTLLDTTPDTEREDVNSIINKLMMLDILYKMITIHDNHAKIITMITTKYAIVKPLIVEVDDNYDDIINRYLDYLICLENFFYDKSTGLLWGWSSELEGIEGLTPGVLAYGGGVDKLFKAIKEQRKIYPGPKSISRLSNCRGSGCRAGVNQAPEKPVVNTEEFLKKLQRVFSIENIKYRPHSRTLIRMPINKDGSVDHTEPELIEGEDNGIKFNGKVLSPHVFMSYFAEQFVQGGGNLKTKRKYKRRNTKRRNTKRSNTKRRITKRRNTKRKNTKRIITKRRITKRRNTKRK